MMYESLRGILNEKEELSVRYDKENAAIWCYFNPKKRSCFSITMLKEIYSVQQAIIKYFHDFDMKPPYPIRYFVLASQIKGTFNFGGDLNLFSELIVQKNREKLLEYATLCIDTVYLNAVSLNLPITTIAFVEGSALGGGFESALSSNIIIASKEAKMGFPEIRFNLFPGMGAFSLLARFVGTKIAEEMIASGKIYSSQELYQKGIVTHIATDGFKSVEKFMKKHSKVFNGMQAIQSAKNRYQAIDYDELMDITKIWVETALKITPNDLKMMKKFVAAQEQKNIGFSQRVRTFQDRRVALENLSFPFKDIKGNIILHDRRKISDRRLCS